MSSQSFALTVEDLQYRVKDGASFRTILDIKHLEIACGEIVGLRGMSGSGKSTFLKLICGILTPQKGNVYWGTEAINRLSESQRDDWRGRHCGFLFQDFRLFGGLSAFDNVLLPLTFRGTITQADRCRAKALLDACAVPAQTQVSLLSRGEMQRTALVRVLMSSPQVILADEPTGNLDPQNAWEIMMLLQEVNKMGTTVVVVTHNNDIVDVMQKRVVTLSEGTVVRDDKKGGYEYERD